MRKTARNTPPVRVRVGGAARRLFAGLLLLGLAGASGCAGKGDISGQVTYNGKPLPAGRVTFVSEVGKKPALSAAIKDGRYSIPGCPAGPVKISVETFPPVQQNMKGPPPPGMPQDLTEFKSRAQDALTDQYASPPGQYVKLPQRYGNPEGSGLDYVVTRGTQEHDIPLAP